MRCETRSSLFVLLAVAAAVAAAQTPKHAVSSDKDKVVDALRAGPTFITKSATILDWPSTAAGEYRVLRKGTDDWSCLPGSPQLPHDEPMCLDRVFLQFMKDSLAGRNPQADGLGVAYMYGGAWVPHSTTQDERPDQYFHVGPHIMIVTPNQNDLRAFTTNGAGGDVYINHLPGRREMFLVIPIRGWDERPR